MLQQAAVGLVLSFVVLLVLLVWHGGGLSAELCLYDALPLYRQDGAGIAANLFKLNLSGSEAVGAPIYNDALPAVVSPYVDYNNRVTRIEDMPGGMGQGDVVGIAAVVYQPETAYQNAAEAWRTDSGLPYELDALQDLSVLQSRFYSVENTTRITAQDFDVNRFLGADLRIAPSDGLPKVLIFHTHSTEYFADGDRNNLYDGIVGVGRELADILTNEYGIPALHCAERFDYIDGRSQITGAYERMEPVIQRMLDENPSIELVIDIHRDGVPDDSIKFVTEVNGKPTAKIMFVNGLTKLWENGALTRIESLPNPYLHDNLAFSFRMQLAANELYPAFARKVYLKAYRYSLHMRPKSLLVEVGAQTNTREEALNAMAPLAEILANVVLP